MLCPGRRLSPSGCEGSVPASYFILLLLLFFLKRTRHLFVLQIDGLATRTLGYGFPGGSCLYRGSMPPKVVLVKSLFQNTKRSARIS